MPLRFITCFVTVFATVIAITKDLADVEGDRKFGVETFSTRLGVRNVAYLGASVSRSHLRCLRNVGAFVSLPCCVTVKSVFACLLSSHSLQYSCDMQEL